MPGMRRGFLQSAADSGEHDAGTATVTSATGSHIAVTFDGEWEDELGMVVEIEGTKMTTPDGACVLTVVSRKRCAFKMNSKLRQGTLTGDGSKLTWSDGVVWTRRHTIVGSLSNGDKSEQAPARDLGHDADEVGAWVRSLDAGSVAQYEPQLCALFGSLSEIKERYSTRPQGFFEDVSVESSADRMTFARALRRLRKPTGAGFSWQRASERPTAPRGEVETGRPGNSGDSETKLSLQQILMLQKELREGFEDSEFQRRLKLVEAKHGKASKNYTDEHTQLFLSVQNEILPRYGFVRGQGGVIQMLKEAARYNENREFQEGRSVLNQLLGLEEPAHQLVPLGRPPDAPLITESLRFRLRQSGGAAAALGSGGLAIMK